MEKLGELINKLLKSKGINEGNYHLPFGNDNNLSNHHPFILTLYIKSDNKFDIEKRRRNLKNEINKEFKKIFKKTINDIIFQNRSSRQHDFEYELLLSAKFYDWKIKDIIIHRVNDVQNIPYGRKIS